MFGPEVCRLHMFLLTLACANFGTHLASSDSGLKKFNEFMFQCSQLQKFALYFSLSHCSLRERRLTQSEDQRPQ